MFAWERLAAHPITPSTESPRFWTTFQRQQRLATALLRVHALSSAITYEPNEPLRVDATQWWREIKQQSVAAVNQRKTRKRRLHQSGSVASDPMVTETLSTENSGDHDDVKAEEQAVHDLLVEALVRILQSLSMWTKTVDRDKESNSEFQELLVAVEEAIGAVGVELVNEWCHAPQLMDDDNETTDRNSHCAAQIVNVVLQFCTPVGSFHPFHEHKLCASTAQRLFRTTPRWSCSKCSRTWETHGATVPTLVFHCTPCNYTLCRECFTRIPNSTMELEEIALRQELFRVKETLETHRFIPLVARHLLKLDRTLFTSLVPHFAIAARGRLQDLLQYRSQEMVPMMQTVLDLFSIPDFPRALIEKEPEMWLPIFISSAKLRLYTFFGPLMWWTSMSDEPGEINLTQEGRRDGTSTALTLQWFEGYKQLRPMLHQLFDSILADDTQDPFVVDALITYLATTVVCFRVTRTSGQNTDDLYDGILINMSSALVHVILPVLESRSHLIQTVYHQSYVPQRVYHFKVEPLRIKTSDNEQEISAADDRRVQEADVHALSQRQAGRYMLKEYFYPSIPKHFGVLCDFCHGADFEGLRYKCAVCEDADICARCYENFAKRPIMSEAEQEIERAADPDLFHCTDHVFLRLDMPMPLIAANHYVPVEFDKSKLLYTASESAVTIGEEMMCFECAAQLDQFDIYYRCSNCLDPRLICPTCLTHEEQHHNPNRMHLPGHIYMAIPRPWRQTFNPCRPGLHSRGLVYPACVYPRERFTTETEIMYITIEALHIGPLTSLTKLLTTVKEMHELRSFCACEEQRVKHGKEIARTSGRRPPKLSAHYAATQARLADLGATRLMAEMHLLETSNVIDWLTFYSRTCRWLLELASPTQNPFKRIVTQFSRTFSSFPQHFFFDVCDIVHVLTLDGTNSSSDGGIGGGIDYQSAMASTTNPTKLLEPLLVMLVQLLATRKCTKNPHLRVQAAKALSSLVSFYAKSSTLVGTLRKVFKQCAVLRDFAVQAVLQFHEDMESYHIRNNGLVFNNNAGSGDHLLWGFLSIRVTTVLLLRFMWQFSNQRSTLARAFRMKNRNPEHVVAGGDTGNDTLVESHIANQVSMVISGLWGDAAKLFEEGNAKVGVLVQLADIREALLEGRQVQLPFRPSMLEGYIALHSKHLRISMRMLVEVLEFLSWMADNTQLKRAMLKPELSDQCARTLSFLMSSLVAEFKAETLGFTWHHLQDSKRVFAHLVFLVTRCAAVGSDSAEKSASPSQFWNLVQESGNTMLRFIGDVEVHNRWTLNNAVVRMESARYLGADTDDAFECRETDVSQTMHSLSKDVGLAVDSNDGIDENDALALLEQQSAEALTTMVPDSAGVSNAVPPRGRKVKRQLARQLSNRFVSALATDGRFDYEAFLSGCQFLLRQSTENHLRGRDNDQDYEYVGLAWMALYMDVLQRCQDMVSLQASMDELLSDIPEEFLDPLLSTIMTDPVRLPSGNIVDRAVIERHLLSTNRVDPFTREPLTAQMLTPVEPLRDKIQLYLRSKLQHLSQEKEDVLATWGLAWDSIFDVVGDTRP